jgi:hypothetical protein
MRILIACLLAATASAPAQEDASLLAGPSVSEEAPTTLVRLGYDGAIERPGVRIEEAALELLELDASARARVDEIVAERAAILDKAVIENIELLVEFQSAKSAGDELRQAALIGRFVRSLAALEERGSLREELGRALGDDEKARFESLIDEYNQAILAEARDAAKERGERFIQFRFVQIERLKVLGQEIKRSYDRQIGSRTEDFERLLAALALSPEREAEVRRVVTDFARRTLLNPDEKDRAGLFIRIASMLSADERRRLVEFAREGRASEATKNDDE